MRKTIYEFTIYICIIPEIAWEKCKNRQGRWVEYVYIKLGVTDVGRLPERMEEIPGTISKYCIPLIAVTIRLEIEHKEYEPIPTWESTRKAYEEELRRRMWNSCFTDDVFQRNRETGGEEWGWVPYWDLVNKERSIKFCDKFFDNIRKQNSEWKKNNFIIKKITPFFAVRFDDDSRMALTICKDYKTEGDRSQEALYKYYSVLEDLYKNKLINEINSGRLRLAAEGECGLNLADSLTFPKVTTTPKEFKQGDRAIHWITSTDELGRTYISHVTEVIVENPDKNALMVSFEKKNIHRGIYSPDMITQHFKSGDPLIEILPHNLWARDQVQEMFMNGIRMVCIPRCCGTGKSYIALGFTYLYSRVLIVTSKNAIKDQFKDVIGNRATFITYQSLKNPNQLIGYDLIIFDECHHLEAPEWKDWSLSLISCNPDSKILGLTATPDRNDGINIIDSFFGGNHAADLTLPEAWSCGLLTIPIYVCGSYIEKNSDIEELVEMVEKSNVPEENKREARASIDKLNKIRVDWINSGGINSTLNKYLPSWAEKVIIFCENIDQLKKQKDIIESWFLAIGRRPTMLEIHSKNSRKTNLYNITEFRRPIKNGEIKVILSVDMFGEGIHEQGIDALIFLRRTSSNIVYLQHIGRCLSVRDDGRKPIVFDLVGNIYNVDFGGIIRYKNELDKIEDRKIAAGEKKESERKIVEIQGDIIEQLELVERIKFLCNTIQLNLEKLYKYKENSFNGLSKVEDPQCYRFVIDHREGNSHATTAIYEICTEAWEAIKMRKSTKKRLLMPLDMVTNIMIEKGVRESINCQRHEAWDNVVRYFESDDYYIPWSSAVRKEYGLSITEIIQPDEIYYSVQEVVDLLSDKIMNCSNRREFYNQYAKNYNQCANLNNGDKLFPLSAKLLSMANKGSLNEVFGLGPRTPRNSEFIPADEVKIIMIDNNINQSNVIRQWNSIAENHNKENNLKIPSYDYSKDVYGMAGKELIFGTQGSKRSYCSLEDAINYMKDKVDKTNKTLFYQSWRILADQYNSINTLYTIPRSLESVKKNYNTSLADIYEILCSEKEEG